MSRLQQLALSEQMHAFAERLIARHPEWEQHVSAYKRVHPGDTTAAGSLWLEVPSPHEPDVSLWAIVEDGDALVGLGHRAAEMMFIPWRTPNERNAAFNGILNFIDDVASGEEVGAWRRHRFLWLTSEGCQFCRLAEALEDRRVVRITSWPSPVQARSAAT